MLLRKLHARRMGIEKGGIFGLTLTYRLSIMALFIREIRRGRTCALFAMGGEDDCPVWDFLKVLQQEDADEFQRITALLDYTAEEGPPKNVEKCRFIRELRVFEFKTRGGVRIMAFWDSDRMIVCSHGFMKKSQKTPQRELNRAGAAREEYFRAKARNELRFE